MSVRDSLDNCESLIVKCNKIFEKPDNRNEK